ncbi:AraC family transcriptional regulator [Pseudonocardiaceae bacterium YIM PH 21723]|nr:AraC family transcriptional regulator [Pseudonocardiaceae bacterium YIM PH 21723]
MSSNGQFIAEPGAIAIAFGVMPRGHVFDWHEHPIHQFAWAARGMLTVQIGEHAWLLPPSRALWIPAGIRHRTSAASVAAMRSLYFAPDEHTVDWTTPTVVAVGPLLAELIEYLAQPDLTAAARARADAVVLDLLRPVPVTTIEVPEPREDRARRIHRALTENPADDRELADWGRLVGASGRTLTRIFLAETGLTFGRWRTLVRLHAALPLLAGGASVSVVARRVGYATPSAFVAAFRRATGLTPGGYFADR